MLASTFVYEGQQVEVPAWVADRESFRRWTDSADFPESGRICFLKGRVWVDMSREQLFTHVQVKGEYTIVLGKLAKRQKRGRYFTDGVYLTNASADISVKPDGMFVSFESFETEKVRLIEGVEEGFVELAGSPDMVLEVVSQGSVQKDTETLFQAYWEAAIQEYWLVDARKAPFRFDIYQYSPRGYVPTRKQGGWLKSAVFGKSFRLIKNSGPDGQPEFNLLVR